MNPRILKARLPLSEIYVDAVPLEDIRRMIEEMKIDIKKKADESWNRTDPIMKSLFSKKGSYSGKSFDIVTNKTLDNILKQLEDTK